jgi:hypothetical protein
MLARRHNTQHKDIQHNDTQHKGLICDIQHNDIQHNDTKHNNNAIMLNVIMLSVVKLNVIAPLASPFKQTRVGEGQGAAVSLYANCQSFNKCKTVCVNHRNERNN